MVNKVLAIVMSDRRLKLRQIVEMVGISEERIFHILHEILGMRKLTSRWVPRLLTVENKRVRMTISKQCLELFHHDNVPSHSFAVATAKLIELQYELLDLERAMGKDRHKPGGASLRSEAPNEPGFKGRNWVSVPRGRTLTPDVPVRSYALAFGHGI
ncbi:hypothetical protein ALC57_17822 [Trachymyrmex cornetzi]|uniref:Histone-lysine N-methyltransferase SETMAR n=1 Tax=Trachymyrmex cornetzi TaxID=471704 RepID=A0A151IT30_9HYME|nr:hypothetical protein ALC57_17822 [Trachymyrmex cornetzi]